MASGRLTRKIQRQPIVSTITPPSGGPPIAAAANVAPISPWYRPRSRGGTSPPTVDSASGTSPPAPMPCTTRNATSCDIVCAAPHSAEPTRKSAIAPMNGRRAPCTSTSFPYSGTVTVSASMYAVTIHE